jgi:hypothetical protein
VWKNCSKVIIGLQVYFAFEGRGCAGQSGGFIRGDGYFVQPRVGQENAAFEALG